MKTKVNIMKLTAMLLLGALLQMNANADGQTITLSEKRAPLETLFKKIEKQTGYHILYASQLLADLPGVTISVRHADVIEVLDLILKDKKLGYEINGRTIVIRPCRKFRFKIQAPLPIPNPMEERNLLADGSSVDSVVNIIIKQTPYWTIIEMHGEFYLDKVDQNNILLVSSRVYDKRTMPMQIKKVILIQRMVVMKGYYDMQVWAYEKRYYPFVIFRGKVPGVKIVLQTGCSGRTVVVWVPGRNSSGVSVTPGPIKRAM